MIGLGKKTVTNRVYELRLIAGFTQSLDVTKDPLSVFQKRKQFSLKR